jgi:hypothetical protein
MCKISLTPSGEELEQIKAHHYDIRNVFKSCGKMGLSTSSILNVCSNLLEKLRTKNDEHFVEQSEQIEDTTDLAHSITQPTLNVARKVFCPHVNTFFPDRKGKEKKIHCPALYDTGATFPIIALLFLLTMYTAEEIEKLSTQTTTRLKIADGTSTQPLRKIVLHFQMDNESMTNIYDTFYIMPVDSYKIILGCSFFEKYSA